jgi:hypothetical protein
MENAGYIIYTQVDSAKANSAIFCSKESSTSLSIIDKGKKMAVIQTGFWSNLP